MKSVPPLVAPAKRHMLIAVPFTIPPKIVQSRMSFVTSRPGIMSVKKPTEIIDQIERIVNFLPTYLKQIIAGTIFNPQ